MRFIERLKGLRFRKRGAEPISMVPKIETPMQPTDTKPQNSKSRTPPEYRQAWENFDAERGMLSGAPLIEPPPPAPRMAFGAHRTMPPRLLADLNLEARTGWLVRLCALGEQGWCLGVIAESDTPLESSVFYAVLTNMDRQRVELELGENLDQIFADGVAVDILARGTPLPRSLVWIGTAEQPRTYSIRAASHNDDGLRRAHEQQQARTEATARHEKALGLREKFSAQCRPWPAWIPDWIEDALRAATAPAPQPKRTFSNDC